MWKNPFVAAIAGVLLGFFGGYLAGQRQPRPPAAAPAVGDPHAGVPGAPPLSQGAGPSTREDLAKRLAELEARLARNGETYEDLVMAGNLLYDMGDFARANMYYEKARRIRDDSPDVLTDSGVAYRETGNPTKAAELFERAAKLSPQHWQSRFNLLVVKLFDFGDVAGAERALQELEALPVKPSGLPDLTPFRKEIASRKAGQAR